MIHVAWFVAVVCFLVVCNVATVLFFLRELRPLVRAVIARNSGELAMTDSVAEPRTFPTLRRPHLERDLKFREPEVRPLGLSG